MFLILLLCLLILFLTQVTQNLLLYECIPTAAKAVIPQPKQITEDFVLIIFNNPVLRLLVRSTAGYKKITLLKFCNVWMKYRMLQLLRVLGMDSVTRLHYNRFFGEAILFFYLISKFSERSTQSHIEKSAKQWPKIWKNPNNSLRPISRLGSQNRIRFFG